MAKGKELLIMTKMELILGWFPLETRMIVLPSLSFLTSWSTFIGFRGWASSIQLGHIYFPTFSLGSWAYYHRFIATVWLLP